MSKPSSFSVTCNRLSQYLRERRNQGGLCASVGIVPHHHEPLKGLLQLPTTMNLLPGPRVVDESANELLAQNTGLSLVADSKKAEKAQMTIFYGGKVVVVDDFPADKAMELIKMAGSSKDQNFSPAAPSSSTSAAADRSPVANSGGEPAPATKDCPLMPGQSPGAAVPIARRASLHRFLEKRKDRVYSKAPYQVNASPAKPEDARPWLGLGQQVSKPDLNSENSG